MGNVLRRDHHLPINALQDHADLCTLVIPQQGSVIHHAQDQATRLAAYHRMCVPALLADQFHLQVQFSVQARAGIIHVTLQQGSVIHRVQDQETPPAALHQILVQALHVVLNHRGPPAAVGSLCARLIIATRTPAHV